MHVTPHYLLSQEWRTLHREHDRYDRYSLLIKLAAVLVCLFSLKLGLDLSLAVLFLLVLWFQEGFWRTIQARTTQRLLTVEKLLELPEDQPGMQFYSSRQGARPGISALLKECMLNTLRPAAAYPYVILLGIEVAVTAA
ncbi:hypothetical protein Tel_02150 [Candidatus Tenderia electrophaga]|mgnify:CR=1 FL=1|uniref:Uncharacterized protein n=1 Tax=Candidatus Tenderia electrophaga TaxID=1748243 RepID=A0A0S2TAA8_9GAMM|nr:hypothetical protein Tel_02150 [Candidatus Tenderia electrophaga]